MSRQNVLWVFFWGEGIYLLQFQKQMPTYSMMMDYYKGKISLDSMDQQQLQGGEGGG